MRSVITVISLFIGILSHGQDSTKIKKADAAFDGFSYGVAAEIYEKFGSDTIDIQRKLAICYWKLHKNQRAEELYAQIVTKPSHDPLDVYNYAYILRENGKHAMSEEWMIKYSNRNGRDSRGNIHSLNSGKYEKLKLDQGQFTIAPLKMNSEHQEFAPIYYEDKVIFVSSRADHQPVVRLWNRNNLPYLDLYIAKESDKGLTGAKPFENDLNGELHEGPATFNQAGDYMVFTRSNDGGESEDGKVLLQLYSSRLVDGEWTEPYLLPFNHNDYSCGHPSLTANGQWLYFASNMGLSKGGVDIFKIEVKNDSTFGDPINMGDKINSEGDEMFPFIHPNGQFLFYSSNGKYGLGGLDVFVAEVLDFRSTGKVMNLGAPVNSPQDDFSFILSHDLSDGYFASNREGGKGSDDLYAHTLEKPLFDGKVLRGVVRDSLGNAQSNVVVDVYNSNEVKIKSSVTNSKGEYGFHISQDEKLRLEAKKGYYLSAESKVTTKGDKKIILVDLILQDDLD